MVQQKTATYVYVLISEMGVYRWSFSVRQHLVVVYFSLLFSIKITITKQYLCMNCFKIWYEFPVAHVSHSLYSHDKTNQSGQAHEDHFFPFEYEHFFIVIAQNPLTAERRRNKKKIPAMAHTHMKCSNKCAKK